MGIEFVIDGESNEDFLGEHMWVSGDGQSNPDEDNDEFETESANSGQSEVPESE